MKKRHFLLIPLFSFVIIAGCTKDRTPNGIDAELFSKVKQKELKKFRENLAPGDKVVTIGGVHGKILEINDTTVLINSEGSKIRFEKSAISQSSADLLGTEGKA